METLYDAVNEEAVHDWLDDREPADVPTAAELAEEHELAGPVRVADVGGLSTEEGVELEFADRARRRWEES